MTFGHFEKGKWVVDGALSDCDLHLTEMEYDALMALTILGFSVVSNKLSEVIPFVEEGLQNSFVDAMEFIDAKDSLAEKIHLQYVAYMQEIAFKESRVKALHDKVRWSFKGDEDGALVRRDP